MITLKNAIKLLEAIEKKLDEVGPDLTLERAKEEAETIIAQERKLPPEQEKLLREYIAALLEQMLNPGRMPTPPPSGLIPD